MGSSDFSCRKVLELRRNKFKSAYRYLISETEFIYTMEPANNGHTRDWSNIAVMSGDRYRQVGYNMGSLVGTY